MAESVAAGLQPSLGTPCKLRGCFCQRASHNADRLLPGATILLYIVRLLPLRATVRDDVMTCKNARDATNAATPRVRLTCYRCRCFHPVNCGTVLALPRNKGSGFALCPKPQVVSTGRTERSRVPSSRCCSAAYFGANCWRPMVGGKGAPEESAAMKGSAGGHQCSLATLTIS